VLLAKMDLLRLWLDEDYPAGLSTELESPAAR
jgi:hypothetical protein